MAAGKIRVGIGGWDFDPWRGTFYPDGLARTKQLAYAAERLTAIEINATYYGRQKPESFAKWAKAVPDNFKFSLKASRYSTNRRVLAEAADSVKIFLGQGFTELGDKLGPIVWEFAPTKKFDPDDFADFLKLLPEKQDGLKLQHVLEVRNDSFCDPAFYALAKKANCAIAFADSDEFPMIDEATADFSYARLQRSVEDCPTGYDARALGRVAKQARGWAADGREAYVYFISGAKVRNPAAAMKLIERLG